MTIYLGRLELSIERYDSVYRRYRLWPVVERFANDGYAAQVYYGFVWALYVYWLWWEFGVVWRA